MIFMINLIYMQSVKQLADNPSLWVVWPVFWAVCMPSSRHSQMTPYLWVVHALIARRPRCNMVISKWGIVHIYFGAAIRVKYNDEHFWYLVFTRKHKGLGVCVHGYTEKEVSVGPEIHLCHPSIYLLHIPHLIFFSSLCPIKNIVSIVFCQSILG
jgi:hypothetical protein